jgi:hypothetical protein
MSSPASSGGPAVLLVGDAAVLAEAVVSRLQQSSEAVYVGRPSDAELTSLLTEDRWRAVVILTRDDVLALRLALLSAHIRADLPLWVTMFDRTVIREMHHFVPRMNVISPADLVAEALASLCVQAGATPVGRIRRGVRLIDDALRLLARAGVGLFAALLVETVTSIIALHHGLLDALYFSTRSVATVAAAPGAAAAPGWYKLVSTVDTVAAVLLVAVFTAALVRRLSRPRLTALFGPLAAPARGHVLLVGFGQVGFRLAQRLRERGIPVVVAERDENAPCVRLARAAGIPMTIRPGEDRATLELLGIRHCSVVAAVTSSDLVNVEVALAATDLAAAAPVVLRLGDGEVAAETDSLLHMGRICDAHAIVARSLVRSLNDAAISAAPADGFRR